MILKSKLNKILASIFFLFSAMPLLTHAASPAVTALLGNIAKVILNPIIVLGFVVATVYFFYSIVQLIWGADSKDLADKRRGVIYGVIGLFVMFSVYGILNIVLKTFNIDCTGIFFCGQN